jgi:MFS family permease
MSQSIMLDKFDEKERQLISGFQFSFINLGGIIMSVLSGLMITLVWYGGYLLLLFLIPVVILAAVVLPKEKLLGNARGASPAGAHARRTKLPAAVAYYGVALFLFSLMYNVVSSNISTYLSSNHLGNSATAGIATAIFLAGGVVSGTFFSKLSVKLDDYMIPAAFLLLFIGYTLLNLFPGSLPIVLISIFVAGTSACLCLPQWLSIAGGLHQRDPVARRGFDAVPFSIRGNRRAGGRRLLLSRHHSPGEETRSAGDGCGITGIAYQRISGRSKIA